MFMFVCIIPTRTIMVVLNQFFTYTAHFCSHSPLKRFFVVCCFVIVIIMVIYFYYVCHAVHTHNDSKVDQVLFPVKNIFKVTNDCFKQKMCVWEFIIIKRILLEVQARPTSARPGQISSLKLKLRFLNQFPYE